MITPNTPRSSTQKFLPPQNHEPVRLTGVTWTSGKVTLTQDLIFGLCLLSDAGWVPLSDLDEFDRDKIVKLVDNDASCPFWKDLQPTLWYLYYLGPDRQLTAVLGATGKPESYDSHELANAQAARWSVFGNGDPVVISTKGELHITRDGVRVIDSK